MLTLALDAAKEIIVLLKVVKDWLLIQRREVVREDITKNSKDVL